MAYEAWLRSADNMTLTRLAAGIEGQPVLLSEELETLRLERQSAVKPKRWYSDPYPPREIVQYRLRRVEGAMLIYEEVE